MSITVGDLREFLSDSANSMADTQAGRIMDRVVQSTMRRLSREGDWTWKRQRDLLFFERRLQSTNVTVANGSVDVAVDPNEPDAFPLERRFFDEKWNVQLGGRETIYLMAEPPRVNTDGTGLIKLTTPYGGEDTTPGSFDTLNLTRSRYSLPQRFKHLFQLDLPQEGVRALGYLSRSDFEVYRRGLLTSASQPWVYTTYGNEEVEIWPPAAEDRGYEAEVDYQAELRVPARGADDSEVVDWPDYYEDLVWACARLQLAKELGDDAVQFDVPTVAGEYQLLLRELKAADQGRGQKVWSMGGGKGNGGTPRPFGLNLRGPVGTDP